MVGAQASKMVLKIRYKFFLIYLGTKGAAIGTTARDSPKGLADWLDNLSFNSRSGKGSGKATKRRSLQGQPRLWTNIILEQAF